MRTGSHLHSKVGGKKAAEYGWFSLGATLPLIATPAQIAARQIVEVRPIRLITDDGGQLPQLPCAISLVVN
jgi:hypothetical protein